MPDLLAKDKALIARCLTGDQGAWEGFIQRFDPFLRDCLASVASRRGIPCRPEDVEDWISKVWETLLADDRRLFRRWPADTSLDRWVLAIGINILLTSVRAKARQQRHLQAYQASLPPALETALFETALERGERLARIRAALGQLPPRERFALNVFYWAGWPHREIARLLRIPLNHVGPLLESARNHLRERLRSPENFLF